MTDDEILSANERELVANARKIAANLEREEEDHRAEVMFDLIALTERLATDAARLSAEREKRA